MWLQNTTYDKIFTDSRQLVVHLNLPTRKILHLIFNVKYTIRVFVPP